ncbi:PadR family transcriptional regulator [Clostridiaceae bacterium M8S5]|nr:PadR family transcriptional regulator [Clostridiaceae bacterium M8S5]
MEISKEVLKGYIDTIILSIVNKNDCYGYEIAKTVRDNSNGSFELKEGTLYIALKRLEKNEYIKSYWYDGISNGGRRKYYKMTQKGIIFLEYKIKEWEYMKDIINNFLGGYLIDYKK